MHWYIRLVVYEYSPRVKKRMLRARTTAIVATIVEKTPEIASATAAATTAVENTIPAASVMEGL